MLVLKIILLSLLSILPQDFNKNLKENEIVIDIPKDKKILYFKVDNKEKDNDINIRYNINKIEALDTCGTTDAYFLENQKINIIEFKNNKKDCKIKISLDIIYRIPLEEKNKETKKEFYIKFLLEDKKISKIDKNTKWNIKDFKKQEYFKEFYEIVSSSKKEDNKPIKFSWKYNKEFKNRVFVGTSIFLGVIYILKKERKRYKNEFFRRKIK